MKSYTQRQNYNNPYSFDQQSQNSNLNSKQNSNKNIDHINNKSFLSRPASAMEKQNNFSKSFYSALPNKSNNRYNDFSSFRINDSQPEKDREVRFSYESNKRSNQSNNYLPYTGNTRPSSAVFFGDKTKTSNFFKTTRIDSCSHIVEHKGKTFAIPYKVTNQKGRPLSAFKFIRYKKQENKSTYKTDYTVKPIMHAGMGKKPLVLYNPTSYRSRLGVSDGFIPYKNTSRVELGVKTDINTKQWMSTTRDSFQWPKVTPITHTGILASTFRESHQKFYKHN